MKKKEKSFGVAKELDDLVEELGNEAISKKWNDLSSVETANSLPEKLIEDSEMIYFIPVDWNFEKHMVISVERYKTLSQFVKDTFGKESFTVFKNIMDGEIQELAETIPYEKAKKSFEDFETKAYAAVAETEFAPVKQAFNRGIINK